VYNLIKNFFEEHYLCTKYAKQCSLVVEVKTSVIQGSGLGPASYLVTASDLHPVTGGNWIFKYADDTYLVVPAANLGTQCEEITNIKKWAADNNLRLNRAKSKEILFIDGGGRGKPTQPLPPPCLDIERVTTLRVLCVIVNDRLTATDHVDNLLQACSKLLYAVLVLLNHGVPLTSLHDVFRATEYSHCQIDVLALDLEGVHDVKLHHPSSSVATSNQ